MLKPGFIVITLLLLFGVLQNLSAQDQETVDSLKAVLNEKRGKDRMDVLWTLVRIYWDKDTVEASRYIQESYRLARTAPVDSLYFVKTGKVKAMLLRLFERYGESFTILDEILPVARRHGFDDEVSSCLSVEGVMYSMLGKYDKALSYQMECLRIREKLKDTLTISITQNNLGLAYYQAGSYSNALHYYFLSLKSKQAIQNHYDEDLLYINIGLCYLYLHDYDHALVYARKGMSLCDDNCTPYIVMNGTLALGMVYQKINRLDSAGIFLTRCYKAAIKEKSRRYQAESLVLMARQANDEGRCSQALRYSIESEKNALQVNSVNMAKQTYYELFRAKRGVKDYEGAVIAWDNYLVYHDSLFNESLSLSLVSAHIDFEQKQNESRLALQESTVQWQGHQNFWIALIGGLLIIAIELLIYDYTGRKRETQRLEVMVHNRTRALAEQVRALEHEEMERRAWEEKLEKAIREGAGRLDVLSEMAGRNDIKAKLPN